jgi:hypothetical protein
MNSEHIYAEGRNPTACSRAFGAVHEGSVAGASAANYPHIRAFGAHYPDNIFYLPEHGTDLTLAIAILGRVRG